MHKPIYNKKEATKPKERIKQAATVLFSSEGFESVSIREISLKANVNVSMISYYFQSKEMLLSEIMDDFIAELEKLELKVNKIKSFQEQLITIVDFFSIKSIKLWRTFYIFFQEQFKSKDNDLSIKLKLYKARLMAFFNHLASQGKLNNLTAEYIYCMVFGPILCYLTLEDTQAMLLNNPEELNAKNKQFNTFLQFMTKNSVLSEKMG